MKKIVTLLVILFVITMINTTMINIFAETNYQVDVDWGEQKEVSIKVNGEDIFFGHGEPTPYIDEYGRTQVPIRFVSEALGCKVTWNGKERTVVIANETDNIKLTIGKSVAEKNGKSIYFDTVPFIKDNRTFVPIRFISEAFLDAKVEWDEKTKLVSITVDKELLISTDFKKIRDKLGTENVYIQNSLLLYSYNGNPSYANSDIDIGLEDDKRLSIGIDNFEDGTLNAVKEIIKIYYSVEYESVYSKFIEVVNGKIQYNKDLEYRGVSGYFDNRYFSATKFENGIGIYIGEVGVKY